MFISILFLFDGSVAENISLGVQARILKKYMKYLNVQTYLIQLIVNSRTVSIQLLANAGFVCQVVKDNVFVLRGLYTESQNS